MTTDIPRDAARKLIKDGNRHLHGETVDVEAAKAHGLLAIALQLDRIATGLEDWREL